MPSIIDGAKPAGDKILIADGVRFEPKERSLIIDGERVLAEGGAPCTEEQVFDTSDNPINFASDRKTHV